MHPELIFNKTVLILGAGVGVEAQAVAMMGASRVIATDIHPTTLKLLEYGASQAGREIEQKIRIQVLDLFNHQRHPLPYCDIMIVADVLYNDELANQVAKRCAEARARKPPPKVLVSDSQRFVHTFDSNLNQRFKDMNHPSRAVWTSRRLPQFTGSGVCIDCDQTYDVKARVMWIGLDDDKKPETESQ
jgi:predicted nicotinamide N-methyase